MTLLAYEPIRSTACFLSGTLIGLISVCLLSIYSLTSWFTCLLVHSFLLICIPVYLFVYLFAVACLLPQFYSHVSWPPWRLNFHYSLLLHGTSLPAWITFCFYWPICWSTRLFICCYFPYSLHMCWHICLLNCPFTFLHACLSSACLSSACLFSLLYAHMLVCLLIVFVFFFGLFEYCPRGSVDCVWTAFRHVCGVVYSSAVTP